MTDIKPRTSANDAMYAACVGSPAERQYCFKCPQTLMDMMPSADAYLARLRGVVLEFMPAQPVLTCTTLDWWVDRAVAYLCNCDVHASTTTIQ
jgi:hypothetical protein